MVVHVQVALRVRKAIDDPDCHIDAAAKLVAAEPLLSARVVAMANSVAYNRAGREITDVRTAVVRMGFRTVRSLATALVTRQMAGGPASPGSQELAAKLWEHTAGTGIRAVGPRQQPEPRLARHAIPRERNLRAVW